MLVAWANDGEGRQWREQYAGLQRTGEEGGVASHRGSCRPLNQRIFLLENVKSVFYVIRIAARFLLDRIDSRTKTKFKNPQTVHVNSGSWTTSLPSCIESFITKDIFKVAKVFHHVTKHFFNGFWALKGNFYHSAKLEVILDWRVYLY
jgi:hypothetical protein